MKNLLILAIKIYWAVIPKKKRRSCIFRLSCSQYVYQQVRKAGFNGGLRALKFRFLNCRGRFHVFEDHIKGTKKMILPNGRLINEDEISERFLSR